MPQLRNATSWQIAPGTCAAAACQRTSAMVCTTQHRMCLVYGMDQQARKQFANHVRDSKAL